MSEETKHPDVKYHTPHAHSASIWLGGQEWKAVNSVLTLPVAEAQELDGLAATRGDISSNFHRILSVEEADAIAREHATRHVHPQAIAGHLGSAGAIIKSDTKTQEHVVIPPNTPAPPSNHTIMPTVTTVPPAASGGALSKLLNPNTASAAAASKA